MAPARRFGELRGQQRAGDGVSVADLALDDLEQVIERAGVGGELMTLRGETHEADAALGERLVDGAEIVGAQARS